MKTDLPDEEIAVSPFADNDETDILIASPDTRTALDQKKQNRISSINLSGDKLILVNELPGLCFKETQYYDLKGINYISNTGLANLIEFLKSLLQEGIEVRFVNVNSKIKNKIRAMGLEHVINCT